MKWKIRLELIFTDEGKDIKSSLETSRMGNFYVRNSVQGLPKTEFLTDISIVLEVSN